VAALWDRVDLLHCASSGAPAWGITPTVMTVHDIVPLVFDDGLPPGAVSAFRRQLQHGIRRAARIIAVSSHTKIDLCRVFDLDPARVVVIPWGVDPAPESGGTGRTELSAEPYVMAFGGEARRKNSLGIIKAFLRAVPRLPEVRLVFVGMGPGAVRDAVAEEVRAAGADARVQILGYVSEEELESLYERATCLLYLSKYEGFGLPLLEALSRGLPILAANRTSIPEVVGDAAVLVDPDDLGAVADALVEICRTPSLRQGLRIRGPARARQYSWRRTAEQTIGVFEAVAART
jgi:glycosyltransferase involved in cell wall biosynthesis